MSDDGTLLCDALGTHMTLDAALCSCGHARKSPLRSPQPLTLRPHKHNTLRSYLDIQNPCAVRARTCMRMRRSRLSFSQRRRAPAEEKQACESSERDMPCRSDGARGGVRKMRSKCVKICVYSASSCAAAAPGSSTAASSSIFHSRVFALIQLKLLSQRNATVAGEVNTNDPVTVSTSDS